MIFTLTFVAEDGRVIVGAYRDEHSLPAGVTSADVRRAKNAVGEAIWSTTAQGFLTYLIVKAR